MSNSVRNIGSTRNVDTSTRATHGTAADSSAGDAEFASVMNLAIGAAAGSDAAHRDGGDPQGDATPPWKDRPGADITVPASVTADPSSGDHATIGDSAVSVSDLSASPDSGDATTLPPIESGDMTGNNPPPIPVATAAIVATGGTGSTGVRLPSDASAMAPVQTSHRDDKRHHPRVNNSSQLAATLVAPTWPSPTNGPSASADPPSAATGTVGISGDVIDAAPAQPTTSAMIHVASGISTRISGRAVAATLPERNSMPFAADRAGGRPRTETGANQVADSAVLAAPNDDPPDALPSPTPATAPLPAGDRDATTFGASPVTGIVMRHGDGDAGSVERNQGKAVAGSIPVTAPRNVVPGAAAGISSAIAPRPTVPGAAAIATTPSANGIVRPAVVVPGDLGRFAGQNGDDKTGDLSQSPSGVAAPSLAGGDHRNDGNIAPPQQPVTLAAIQPAIAGIVTANPNGSPFPESRPRSTTDAAAAVDPTSAMAGATLPNPVNAAAGGTGTSDSGSPGGTSQSFGDALANHVLTMASSGHQETTLQLQPPQLGDLTVRVAVQGRDVSAWFGAAQPQVQQAVTQALDQLRLDLAGAGFNLAGAWVGADTSGMQRQFEGATIPARRSGFAAPAIERATTDGAERPLRSSGVSFYV